MQWNKEAELAETAELLNLYLHFTVMFCHLSFVMATSCWVVSGVGIQRFKTFK